MLIGMTICTTIATALDTHVVMLFATPIDTTSTTTLVTLKHTILTTPLGSYLE